MEIAHTFRGQSNGVIHFSIRFVRAIGVELSGGRESMQVRDRYAQQLEREWDTRITAPERSNSSQVSTGRHTAHRHSIEIKIELLGLLLANLSGQVSHKPPLSTTRHQKFRRARKHTHWKAAQQSSTGMGNGFSGASL